MVPSDPARGPNEIDPGSGASGTPRQSWHHRLAFGLRSLKARLTLAAIGALVVSIALISMLSLNQIEGDLLRQTQAREVTQTANLAQDLSQRVVALQQTLRLTGDQIDHELEGLDDALAHRLQMQPALLQQFANLFVAAPDGRVRLVIDEAGPRRPRLSLQDRGYFRQLISERRPVISEAVPGRISGEPIIIIAHPIIRDGKVTSVLGGAIRLTSRNLAASLLDKEGDTGSGELLVISDESGQLIAHPRVDLIMKRLSSEPRLADAFNDWTTRGSPAEPAGLLLHQGGEIVTAAGVAGTSWVVWRTIPQASLLEPLRQARLQALRNAAIVIAVLGVLTFLLVRRLLQPLQMLQERAQSLFDASQDIRDGWPAATGEVGALAHVLRHVGAERARLESFTGELLERLNSVMAAAPLGIAFTRHQRFELVNPAWCRLLQREESELLGHHTAEVFASDADHEQLGTLVRAAFDAAGEYVGEWRFRRRDGTQFWGQLSGRPVAEDNPSAGTIWTLADVTDARASRESLEWSATHDPLTGLANRAAFRARLNAVLGHPPAALVVLDLDRFKPINDQHGHPAGDAMLKVVASALLASVRAGDLVVRMGGDEFAVILERCPPDAARRVAQNIQRAVARAELVWEGQILSVGASVGVTPLSEEFTTVDAWVAAADEACYAAKAAGRGAPGAQGSSASRAGRLQ